MDKLDKKYFGKLVDTIVKLKNRADVEDFLFGILTPHEREQIPRRLEIVRQLKKHIPHQVIAERLHVGVATVTRGSKEIQKGRFKYV